MSERSGEPSAQTLGQPPNAATNESSRLESNQRRQSSPASALLDAWRWGTSAQDIGQITSRALLIIIGATALFALSGGLGVLFMSVFGTSSISLAIPVMLRGGEIFLTLTAALLVFLVILSREGDSILTLFGVVVIAAIIIPTSDIMRMAALVGHTPSETFDMQGRSGRGEIVSYQISETASHRAIDRLLNHPSTAAIFINIDDRNRKTFRDTLTDILYGFEVEQLEMAVRQRGLDRVLLDSLDEARVRQLSMMPASMRLARQDLLALRDMGLISVPLSEFHNLRVNGLGLEVLCRIYPVEQLVTDRVARDNQPRQQSGGDARGLARSRPSLSSPNCLPERRLPIDSEGVQIIAVDLEQARSRGGFEQIIQVPRGGFARLSIEVASGTFEMSAETSLPQGGLDPVLQLIGPDGRELAVDDDSAGNLNSLLVRALTAGRYELRLRDFGAGGGQATLRIRSALPEDWARALPEDAPVLPEEVVRTSQRCELALDGTDREVAVPREGMLMRCQLGIGRWRVTARSERSTFPPVVAIYGDRGSQRAGLLALTREITENSGGRIRRTPIATAEFEVGISGSVIFRLPGNANVMDSDRVIVRLVKSD